MADDGTDRRIEPSAGGAVADHKRQLRQQVRAARAAADPGDRAGAASAWASNVLGLDALREARVVAAYVSYGTEPPTGDLIDALTARGVRVLVPLLLEDRDLAWTAHGDPTATPLGRDAIADADAVVLPALLVDVDGNRLGQGGGSYDRALVRVPPGTPLVALVHDNEVRASGEVPADDHDRRVTYAVTPTRVVVANTRQAHRNVELPVDPDLTVAEHDAALAGPSHTDPRWDIALVIAAGGALGSAARWAIGEALPHTPTEFPWSTFIENVTGCLLLGLLMVFVVDVWTPHRYTRPFLGIGVLGGFTTFSTFAVETRGLVDGNQAAIACAYVVASLIVGLLATWIGLTIGRGLAGVPRPDPRRSDPSRARP